MNIVVIIADQLRVDHLGYSGKVPVRTPNIDHLANSGHIFDRAYVANPVCMPNRSTILTGLWPSAHGVRTNGIPLDPDIDTFARSLRRSGWRTAAVGKLHLQPMGYPYEDYQLAQIKAATPELWESARRGIYGEQYVSEEAFIRHTEGDYVLGPDYYGFDDVALVVGHGDRVSGNYVRWARERGFDPMAQAGRERAKSTYPGWNHIWESAVPIEAHETTYIAEESVRLLESYAQAKDPFLLFVSFPDPHHPFAPPSEYFRRHDPADMPLPTSFDDAHEASPEHIRRIIERRGTPDIDPMMVWSPTADQFRHALAAELGAIEFIDDSVGRIIDSLNSLGLADDTLVLFTSDHGDVFGDHGLILKHFTHYDAVTRVPLLLSGPAIGTGRHAELASSADIAPTLLELAGAPALAHVQGRSLAPLLDGTHGPWRTALLIEEDQPYGLDVLPGPVRMRTVLTDELRMTRTAARTSSAVELYDRSSDPDERLNVAAQAAAAPLLARANAAMVEQLMYVVDDSVVPFNAA